MCDIIEYSKNKKSEISSVSFIENDKFYTQEINELVDITRLPRINWQKVNVKDQDS